jgi:phosphate-selective porin OprO and OprP
MHTVKMTRAMGIVLWLAVAAGPAARAQEKPAPSPEAQTADAQASASAEGFQIGSEGGDFRLQLRGYAQVDGRFFAGDEAGEALDTFLVRRVRPILQGTLARHFDFNLAPDFGGGVTVLQDAYLDVRYSPKVRLRVGKFKSPTSVERLQPASALAFVERALPSGLLPNRDVGLQLHGQLAGGVVAYAAAVLNGAPDGGSSDLDLNDGKELAARIFLSPFKTGTSPLKDLGFGIAATTGEQRGPLAGYRSGGQVTVVTPADGVVFDGRRSRYAPQLTLYSGPFGLMGEYARSRSAVRANERRATFEARAWQATATVLLSGDRASPRGVQPKRPFDPARRQWGAPELAVRVNGLELGGEAFSAGLVDDGRSVRKAFAWALGVNWWLNRNVRQMVSFERTTFTGGAAGGADRGTENALLIRTQLAF